MCGGIGRLSTVESENVCARGGGDNRRYVYLRV